MISTGNNGNDEGTAGVESGASSQTDASTGSTTTVDGSATGLCAGEPEDILVNGGFETWDDPEGEPIPWHVAQGQTYLWNDTEWGANALKIVAHWGDPDGGWNIEQEIAGPFFAGEELAFHARVRLLSGYGGDLDVVINDAGFPQAKLPFVGNTLWEDLEAPIVLTEDAATLPVFFKSFEIDQSVLIDDVRFLRGCDPG